MLVRSQAKSLEWQKGAHQDSYQLPHQCWGERRMGPQEGTPWWFPRMEVTSTAPSKVAYILYYYQSFLFSLFPPHSPSQLSSCYLFLPFLTSNLVYSITLLACLITWASLATLLWTWWILPTLPLGGRELASGVSHNTSRWVRINSVFEQTFEEWYLSKESCAQVKEC